MQKLTPTLFLTGALALGAVSAPAATHTDWFKIVSLKTNNAVFTGASLAGSLSASADHLFASRVRDADFRRWDANGLANPTNFPSGFIIISDLRTEKVYAFADASGTMTDRGTATALHELDLATGLTNGVVIALSASVAISSSCGPEFGIFCGWGRVVVGRVQLSDIALPSGQVTALGTSNPFNQGCDPSEPLTGVAEFFGNELYLVACQRFNGETFERVRLSNGERTTVASFTGLPSQTKLTFSPSRNRWYFSTANSWLNNSPLNEGAVGYADATWDQSDEFPPPPVLAVTMTATLTLAEDTTTHGFGGFVQTENAGTTQIRVVASSNPSLVPSNGVTFFGGGFLGNSQTGAFEFVVNPLPNAFGTATLTFLTTNNIGERATNFLPVTVTPINNDPPQIVGVTNATITRFVPPPHLAAQTVRLTNYFGVIDPDLTGGPPQFSFVTPDPVKLPLSGMSVVPDGTNFQFIIEVPAGQVCYDLTAQLLATDETGLSAAKSFYLYVMPNGIRPGGAIANTDYRAYAQGGLRDVSGSTSLSVTGLVGQVRQALLYVHSALAPTYPTLNGVNLGASGRSADIVGVAADSCETVWNSYLLRFNVSDLVTSNGLYTLGNLLEGSPLTQVLRTVNGVSLLVFYDDGNPANNVDVALYHGNDSNQDGLADPDGWQTLLNDVIYRGGPATLGLHVAYGEVLPEAPIFINGNLWQPQTNLFDGLTVPGRNGGTNRFFWDVREFDLAPLLSTGTNSLLFTMLRTTNTQDCLNLVLATLAQPAAMVETTRPQLTITPVAQGFATVSWTPPNVPGFLLQQSDALVPGGWTNSLSGPTNPIIIPATLPGRFYRLSKP